MLNMESQMSDLFSFFLARSACHAAKHFAISDAELGFACFVPSWALTKYVVNCEENPDQLVGYADVGEHAGGQFVFPLSHVDGILAEAKEKGLKQAISDALAFTPPENESISLLTITGSFDELKPFLPNQNTPGVNEDWLPTGFTKGGVPEMVVPRVPIAKWTRTDLRT